MRPWFFSPAQPLWLIHAGPLLGNTSWSLSCILSCSQFQNWTWNHKEIKQTSIIVLCDKIDLNFQLQRKQKFGLSSYNSHFSLSPNILPFPRWGKIFVSIKIFGWEKIFVNAGDISLSSAQLALIYKIGMSLCLACDWSESGTSGPLIGHNATPDIPDQFER